MIQLSLADIRKNKKLFLTYSKQRRKCAYELYPQTAPVAFEIIPALLSINIPGLPGFVPKGDKAYGVYGIGPVKYLKQTISTYFSDTSRTKFSFQNHLINRPVIESLFLMGSIGTIAQNEASDFDLWVCIDRARITASDLEKLRTKTLKIADWCRRIFNMEVHFFIMDIQDIRNNNFGKVDEESAGSSQKKFLKEEFYRTLLLVNGKIPFWWALPCGVTGKDYDDLWLTWARENPLDSDDFIDLGFLGDIPKEEFLGTTLWHLSKGIKDPFKALIKMAMMERYLSDTTQMPLLCDIIKGRVLAGKGSLRNTDPYLLMIQTILAYYTDLERLDRAELLRKAFYIKADPKLTRLKLISRYANHQVGVFKSLLKEWKWSLNLCEDLNQIEHWSYLRHLNFSGQINLFFSSIYKELRESLPKEKAQTINEHDLTLLGRKLYVLFGKKGGKLQLTPFLKKEKLVLEKCIFQYEIDRAGRYKWHLYDATKYPFEKPMENARIFTSQRVARSAAWLANNGLYDFHKTQIEMTPNPSGLNVNDLIELLKHFQGYFRPALSQIKLGANLKKAAGYNQMMLVADLERGEQVDGPIGTDLIYNNTWGEFYTETYILEEAIAVIADIVRGMKPHEIYQRVEVHIPKGLQILNSKREIFERILQASAAEHKERKAAPQATEPQIGSTFPEKQMNVQQRASNAEHRMGPF